MFSAAPCWLLKNKAFQGDPVETVKRDPQEMPLQSPASTPALIHLDLAAKTSLEAQGSQCKDQRPGWGGCLLRGTESVLPISAFHLSSTSKLKYEMLWILESGNVFPCAAFG